MSEREDLLAAYETAGSDRRVLDDPAIPHLVAEGHSILSTNAAAQMINAGQNVDLDFYARVTAQTNFPENPVTWTYYLKDLSYTQTTLMVHDAFGIHRVYQISLK